jgi:hypothetical protein
MTKGKVLLTTILWICSVGSYAQDSIDFRIKFEVGDRFELSFSITRAITQSVMETQIESKQMENNIIQCEVIGFTPDVITLRVLPVLRESEMHNGPITMKNSSADPDWLNLYNQSTRYALGQNIPYTIKMNSKGYIFEVSDTKAIAKRIKDVSKSLNKKTRAKWLEEMLLIVASKSALVENLNQLGFFYPTHAVKMGDQWSDTWDSDTSRTDYVLKSETDSSYIIECTGASFLNTTLEIEKVSYKMEDKRTFTQQIEVSKKTFFLISQIGNISAESSMTMPLNGQEVTVPMVSQEEATITVKPLKNE